MEIRLGYIENVSGMNSLHIDKVLSDIQFESFSRAIDELHNYENQKRLFEILILNNNEFITFIEYEKKSLFENSLSISGDKDAYYVHHLNLNRMILNYLSSFRTFIDHSETFIKRKYGKESFESEQFDQKTSNIFDKYFSYRFFIKLRNYSQHCGIPIDDFEISATVLEDNKIKTEYKIEFSSNHLLSKFKSWGAIVTADLQKKEKFSIFPLLTEMKLAIDELWVFIVSIFNIDIQNAIQYITQNAGHLKNEKNSVCIFSNIVDDDFGNMKYYTSHTIPFDIIENYRF